MSDEKIVVGVGQTKGDVFKGDYDIAWQILGLTSWVLIAIGGVDLSLALVPARFGVPEWEFGTASVLLDNLPLFSVGVMLQLASAAALGRRVRLRVLQFLMPVLIVIVIVAAVLYALALPLALEAVEGDATQLLHKASIKTGVQAVCYLALFSGVFIVARRQGRG
jgi:hypothetical protein